MIGRIINGVVVFGVVAVAVVMVVVVVTLIVVGIIIVVGDWSSSLLRSTHRTSSLMFHSIVTISRNTVGSPG